MFKIAGCILYHHQDSRQGYRKDLHKLVQKYDTRSIRLNDVFTVPAEFYENSA